MSATKRGPPRSALPTSNMFKSRRFGPKNTRQRYADLSAINVPTGSDGPGLQDFGFFHSSTPVARPGSTAAIQNFVGAASYQKAVTQVPSEEYNPRVTHAFHALPSPYRAEDALTDGLLMFTKVYDAEKSNPKKRTSYYNKRAYVGSTGALGAEVPYTLMDINFECASRPKMGGLEANGRYPSPGTVMAQFNLEGPQYNQAGGQGVMGTQSGLKEVKQINTIIFGDAVAKNVFPPGARAGDTLYLIGTRIPRKQKEFTLDPNAPTKRYPGDNGTSKTGTRPAPDVLEENPCYFYLEYSSTGKVPHIPDAYDDNGYYVTPYVLRLGIFVGNLDRPRGETSSQESTVNILSALNAGLMWFFFLPVKISS